MNGNLRLRVTGGEVGSILGAGVFATESIGSEGVPERYGRFERKGDIGSRQARKWWATTARRVFAGFLLTLWAGSAQAAGPFAYIPNASDSTVSVIDISTNTVVATIPTNGCAPGTPLETCGTTPVAVAVNPAGTSVYVVTQNPLSPGWLGLHRGSIVEINGTTNAVASYGVTGQNPTGVAFNTAGTFAFVSTFGGYFDQTTSLPPSLDVIQTSTQATTAIAMPGAGGVALNPAGTFAYVTDGSHAVIVVNTATQTVVTGAGLPVLVGNHPYGIAMSPTGFAYVGNAGDNTVSVINTATNAVTATIPVGAAPYSIAVDSAGMFAYVANYNDSTVSVIDMTMNAIVGPPIAVGTHPYGISVSPGGNLIYVANGGDNSVSVIAGPTRALVGSPIPVGVLPYPFGQFIVPGPAAAASPTRFGVYLGPMPTAGIAFEVVIQAQDGTSAPQYVTSATAATLSRTAGTGSLSGSLSCTIPAGATSCSLGGVVYSAAESGVVLTATRTSGDVLSPGQSAPSYISPATPRLAVTSLNSGTNPIAGIPFDIVVQAQSGGGTPANVPNDTGVALTLAAGSGSLGGGAPSCTITLGTSSCTVAGITYSKPEAEVKVTATKTSGTLPLASGTSAPFTVDSPASPPQRLVITSVNGGTDPTVAVGFNVGIQVQDGSGIPVNLSASRGVQVMLKAGTGTLGCTTCSCTISTGTNSCTVTGLTYTVAESGVVLNASPSLYDALGAGDSAPFTVDPAPAGSATKLVLLPIPPFSPVAGVPFGLGVVATPASGPPANVVLSTLVTLTRSAGTGTLGGTLTCTILAGTNQCVFPGVTYSKAEPGVQVTATATGGDSLTPSTSPPFTVNAAGPPTQLGIYNFFFGVIAGTPFNVTVEALDGSGVLQNVAASTVVALSVHTGTGTLSGTLGCTIPAGSSFCIVAGVRYSVAEAGVVLTATRSSGAALAAGNSAPFTVGSPPTKLGVSLWGSGDPIAGFAFSMYVESQDSTGTGQNVSVATGVTLSVSTGGGTLGGVMSCTIPAGRNDCIVSGVTYSQPESGVVITASGTSGATLTAGNSAPLTIDAAPPRPSTKLAIISINGGASPTVGVPFTVIVQAQAGNGSPQGVYAATSVSLSRATGSGSLGGGPLNCTIGANANSCVITGVTYSKAESGVSLTATRTSGDTLASGNSATFTVVAGGGMRFYTVTPCRQLDTRSSSPIASHAARTVALTGAPCGLPSGAVSVSVNLAETQAAGGGHLTIYPADVALPAISAMNFNAGQTRSNNAILKLSSDGTGRVNIYNGSGGTVQVIVDVNGYFQ